MKETHSVESVQIKGNSVKVQCSCGWSSKVAKDETTARKEHETHARKK